MNENQLAENLIYYRKKKGLSQEKLSEYMEVSRQAVSKWETNISRPSSDNLIKLAQLFEVDTETLLGNGKVEKSPSEEELSVGLMPWIFIGISVLCIVVYIIYGALYGVLSAGTLIVMFVACVPIQLFLNIYISNAVKNGSFNGIAGFDDKIKYNIHEVKKMMIQINLHIGSASALYVFLLCVINCMDFKIKWLNSLLTVIFLLDFITGIEITNYKMTDKIYQEEADKKRANQVMPINVIYILLLFAGIVITGILFEVRGIENNTLPAMKLCGLLILAVMSATTGLLYENSRIKKWNPADTKYKMSKAYVMGCFLSMVIYGIMCFI